MEAKAVTRDFTPNRALDMGSGPRANKVDASGQSNEPLEVNVLALWESANAEPLVIVTLDLLYPGKRLRDAMKAALPQLNPSRLFIAASHTHRAPMTLDDRPKLGRVDEDFIRELCDIVVSAVREVTGAGGRRVVTLSVGQASAEHSVNRRRRRLIRLNRQGIHINGISMAPNPGGPVDETLALAELRDVYGTPVAYVWNYACHPTSPPQRWTYSSHYPAVVRQTLRAYAEVEVPVLFFQGFSGDTRPSASAGRNPGLYGLLERMLIGPAFRIQMTSRDYLSWTHSLASQVLSMLPGLEPVDKPAITTFRLARPGSEFADGLESEVVFHRVSFGYELSIVGVSGEPVSHYASVARAKSTSAITMCVGCIDEPFGYIPTSEIVLEGGYEGRNFCVPFELERVNPDIETHMTVALSAVCAQD